MTDIKKRNTPVLVELDADLGKWNHHILWAVYLDADALWEIGHVKADDYVMVVCDGDNYFCTYEGEKYLHAVMEHNKRLLFRDVLDYVEKEYLSNVIRPFRDQVTSIVKVKSTARDEEYILIKCIRDCDWVTLPNFKRGTMYKGMEMGRDYTLKELGL